MALLAFFFEIFCEEKCFNDDYSLSPKYRGSIFNFRFLLAGQKLNAVLSEMKIFKISNSLVKKFVSTLRMLTCYGG